MLEATLSHVIGSPSVHFIAGDLKEGEEPQGPNQTVTLSFKQSVTINKRSHEIYTNNGVTLDNINKRMHML